jgi:putative membrane protein
MSVPEIEGRLHPLAVVLAARRVLGAGMVPLLALLVALGTRVLVPLVVATVLVVVPLALLWWRRFTYRVTADRLELRSGIVNRRTRVVSLERVRGVDVTAPFLHRLLGLVKVEIEAAAGGGDAELSLPAVSRADAEALRERLLAGPAVEAGDELPAPLYRATAPLLAIGGLTSGRYLFAPAALVGLLFNIADDLPGGLVERATDAVAERLPTDPVGIGASLVAGFALVLVFAAAGALLVDWDFVLRAEGERFTAERGLFTRRAVSIDRERIRGLDVRDSLLRRTFGLAAVTAVAAGVRRSGGRTTLAPVLRAGSALPMLHSVDTHAPDPWVELDVHPRAARARRLTRALPAPALVTVVALALGWWSVAVISIVLTVAAVPLALDRYRQLGHRFERQRLAVREGSLQRRWTELDPAGIVSFDLRRSPTQTRARVATLVLHLGEGAGSRRALDLGDEQARTLLAELNPRLFSPLVDVSRR